MKTQNTQLKKLRKAKILPASDTLFIERKARIRALDRLLKKLFPDARMALQWRTYFELLVAVVLSAQCTDKKVNEVTRTLFKKYKTVADYAAADLGALEQDIHSTGFFRNKAKNIIAAAKKIQTEFSGEVPQTMEELLTLPGVARKTANVVLGNAFGVVEGVAVDTHVRRFCVRFDLSDSMDPEVIEKDLMRLLPKKDWFGFTYRVIEYGRTIAPARPYDTNRDLLIALYPKAGKVFRV